MSEEIIILKRMLERERQARKSAEKILEQKRFELVTINSQLEELVEVRTRELELLAKFPSHDPSPVMRINLNGIIDYANTSSLNLLSYWGTKVGEKCPNNILILIQKSFEKNLTLEVEIKGASDNGKIYSFILSPVKEFDYVFAYGRDITSLKKTQEALNESKNSYQQLVEDASDIIHRTDIKGRFLYANPVSSEIVEYPTEELIGKSYVSLIRHDYREKAILFYKNQLENKIAETYFEFPIITKNGTEVWLGQKSKIIYTDGIAKGFQSLARNITDRKTAEQELENTSNRLKTLIANLQMGIFMEDENRKLFFLQFDLLRFFQP